MPYFGDKILSELDIESVHEAVQAEIEKAIEFAEESPMPDPATITEDVYA